MIERTDSDRHSAVLAAAAPDAVAAVAAASPAGWAAEPAGFEQLVLAYLRRSPLAAAPAGTAAGSGTAVAS